MRITTSQLFNRPIAQMGTLSQQADTLQTQIATGRRFSAPSADAPAWQRLAGIARADADQAADAANVGLAQTLLAEADTALGSVETQLQRVRELAMRGASGTLNAENRAAIAAELDAIGDELFALANSRDSRGQPLFGGASGDTAFVRNGDGSVSFAGSGAPTAIPIGGGEAIEAGVSGETLFGAVPAPGGTRDLFAIVSGLASALRAGDASGVDAAMGGVDAALDRVNTARASVGARAVRLDLASERFDAATLARAESRSAIVDTDVPTAIAELQKTLTILQATQASFTRLTSLSLFDQLR